jgi:hypothetical protein
VPVLGPVAAHRENDRWTLSVGEVPPGRHRLQIDANDVEASESVQALLPARIDEADRIVTVRRRRHRDAYDVIVESRRRDPSSTQAIQGD